MKLFISATLKLASWYLLILMITSLLFSTIIFQIARSEIDSRLQSIISNEHLSADPKEIEMIHSNTSEQLRDATNNLLVSLSYLNIIVLLAGGVCAYLLARQSLQPIESAHEAQSRFVSNASHQLRTPLAIMHTEIELALKNPKSSKKELQETLQSNLEEVDKLANLSNMLLGLSRIDKNLQTPPETFDLVVLIRDLVEKYQAKSRVEITSPESFTLKSHQTAVHEICAILLDNALKHSPKSSKISINIYKNKKGLSVDFINSGDMKQRELEHIPERFFTTSSRPENYGLGLSLAEQLATAINSHISASSSNGKITFSITFAQS